MFNTISAISWIACAVYFKSSGESEVVSMGSLVIANIYVAFSARDIDRKKEGK